MKLKVLLFALLSFSAAAVTSCSKDDETITIDSSMPQGTFTASKSGSFTEQNGTGSKGAVQLGTDADGTQFLKFGSDFTTNFGTGTVSVYLSTSEVFTADPGNGNPALRLVGPALKAGETFFKLSPAADAKFTHVILWCGTASIPFGFAKL